MRGDEQTHRLHVARSLDNLTNRLDRLEKELRRLRALQKHQERRIQNLRTGDENGEET